MRIISGIKKGKKLLLPDPKTTRPLKDNVKENIFNILNHSRKFGVNFDNLKIIDFFSGSGSFGIECISRGAEKVLFYEQNNKASNVLFRNLSNNFNKNKYEINKENFFLIDKKKIINNFQPDLIFLDPPYKIQEFNKILDFIKSIPKISNAMIILHVEKTKIINFDEFKFVEERVYGLSKVFFIKS